MSFREAGAVVWVPRAPQHPAAGTAVGLVQAGLLCGAGLRSGQRRWEELERGWAELESAWERTTPMLAYMFGHAG